MSTLELMYVGFTTNARRRLTNIHHVFVKMRALNAAGLIEDSVRVVLYRATSGWDEGAAQSAIGVGLLNMAPLPYNDMGEGTFRKEEILHTDMPIMHNGLHRNIPETMCVYAIYAKCDRNSVLSFNMSAVDVKKKPAPKPGRGRPRLPDGAKKVQLHVRLPPLMIEALRARARAERRDMSECVSRILKRQIAADMES